MRLKTKLTLALAFLFLVILTFGILSIFYIKKLSGDADKVLKNNYSTLVYDNNMIQYLDRLPADTAALGLFEQNLEKQEKNITEQGEAVLTVELRKNFETLKEHPADT